VIFARGIGSHGGSEAGDDPLDMGFWFGGLFITLQCTDTYEDDLRTLERAVEILNDPNKTKKPEVVLGGKMHRIK